MNTHKLYVFGLFFEFSECVKDKNISFYFHLEQLTWTGERTDVGGETVKDRK